MNKIGIWIDKKKAHLVHLENGAQWHKTIESNVESYKIKGGSGTKFKGGPQDVVQDSRYLEREKHQLREYFQDVVSEIKNCKALVIIGPSDTPKKFKKELDDNFKGLSKIIRGVYKTDSMTKNQLVAWFKNFYKVST